MTGRVSERSSVRVVAVLALSVALVLPLMVAGSVHQANAVNNRSDVVVFGYRLEDEIQAPENTKVLMLVEPDGSNLRRVATSGTVQEFDVSADGNKIIYSTTDGIWTVGLNGKNNKKLVGRPGLTYMAPTWSPNGKTFWYASFGPSQGVRLHRHHVRKGELNVTVLDDENDDARVHRLDVSPSGNFLLVHPSTTFLDDGFRPFVFNLETGVVDELPYRAKELVWMANDDVLIYELEGFYAAYAADSKEAVDIGSTASLWVDSTAISPDGSALLEVSTISESVTVIDIATGETTPFPLPSDDMFWLSGQVQWVQTSVKPNPKLCNGWVITKKNGRKGKTINGTPGADVISAGGGNDIIDGRGGNDVICGGGGADIVIGGRGDDMLFGNGGADQIDGGLGADKLWGDAGPDELIGGAGKDVLYGNEGDGDTGDGGADYDGCIDIDTIVDCETTYDL